MSEGKRTALGMTIAALVLATQIGSPLAQDAPEPQQLMSLYRAVATGDILAVKSVLATYPALMALDTPLAGQLRALVDALDQGIAVSIPANIQAQAAAGLSGAAAPSAAVAPVQRAAAAAGATGAAAGGGAAGGAGGGGSGGGGSGGGGERDRDDAAVESGSIY